MEAVVERLVVLALPCWTSCDWEMEVAGAKNTADESHKLQLRVVQLIFRPAMDAKSFKNRNKGVEASARVHDEQRRYREHDPQLQQALDAHYDYMIKSIDPVMSPAIEEVLLYQPDQTADFLAQFFRGTLEVKNYNYVDFKRQQYFDRKVRHLLALAMNSAVKDRPEDVRAYFANFFNARTKFY